MEALLSKNKAKSMIYKLYVNMYGEIGHNIADDLSIESMNKKAKPHLQHAPILTCPKCLKGLCKTDEVVARKEDKGTFGLLK